MPAATRAWAKRRRTATGGGYPGAGGPLQRRPWCTGPDRAPPRGRSRPGPGGRAAGRSSPATVLRTVAAREPTSSSSATDSPNGTPTGAGRARRTRPLTDLGREQARRAARAVGAIDAVFASPLVRAAETAEIIAAELGIGPVITLPGLMERHAGTWQGLTRAEIEEQYPGYLAAGRRPPGWEDDDVVETTHPGALDTIAAQHPFGHTLVVSHAGAIFAVEAHHGARVGAPGQPLGTVVRARSIGWIDGPAGPPAGRGDDPGPALSRVDTGDSAVRRLGQRSGGRTARGTRPPRSGRPRLRRSSVGVGRDGIQRGHRRVDRFEIGLEIVEHRSRPWRRVRGIVFVHRHRIVLLGSTRHRSVGSPGERRSTDRARVRSIAWNGTQVAVRVRGGPVRRARPVFPARRDHRDAVRAPQGPPGARPRAAIEAADAPPPEPIPVPRAPDSRTWWRRSNWPDRAANRTGTHRAARTEDGATAQIVVPKDVTVDGRRCGRRGRRRRWSATLCVAPRWSQSPRATTDRGSRRSSVDGSSIRIVRARSIEADPGRAWEHEARTTRDR